MKGNIIHKHPIRRQVLKDNRTALGDSFIQLVVNCKLIK